MWLDLLCFKVICLNVFVVSVCLPLHILLIELLLLDLKEKIPIKFYLTNHLITTIYDFFRCLSYAHHRPIPADKFATHCRKCVFVITHIVRKVGIFFILTPIKSLFLAIFTFKASLTQLTLSPASLPTTFVFVDD